MNYLCVFLICNVWKNGTLELSNYKFHSVLPASSFPIVSLYCPGNIASSFPIVSLCCPDNIASAFLILLLYCLGNVQP